MMNMTQSRQSAAPKSIISVGQKNKKVLICVKEKNLKLLSLLLIFSLSIQNVPSNCYCSKQVQARKSRQIAARLFDHQQEDGTQVIIDHNENNQDFETEEERDLQDNLRVLEQQVDASSRLSRALDQIMSPYNPFTFNGQNEQNALKSIAITQPNTNTNQQQSQGKLFCAQIRRNFGLLHWIVSTMRD